MLPCDDDLFRAIPEAPQVVRVRDVLSRLGLPRSERTALREALDRMVREGRLARQGARRYRRTSGQHLFTGTLTVTRQGFGFVFVEGDRSDIFIRGANLNHAMHRDRVRVEVFEGRDRREEGRILEVVERGTRTFVGIVHRVGKRGWLVPRDERLPDRFRIEGDGAEHGEMVAAEIMAWPGKGDQPGTARVIRRFVQEGEAARETQIAVYDLGLPVTFSDDALQEANAFEEQNFASERIRRRNLTDLPLVTIDPVSARDYDDAIHARPNAEGGWHLTVAVADVAHFVQPGSALDIEAKARCFSAYFPDRVIPMLPDRLSGDLCSLRPNVERLAMVVEIDVSPQGDMGHVKLSEAVIRSHARLTYDRAARLLRLHPEVDAAIEPASEIEEACLPVLESLRDVTRILRKKRAQTGYLDLDIAEPTVILDAQGVTEGIREKPRHEAHLMVEEAMLAANACAAHFCLINDNQVGMFRIHAPPPDEGLEKFYRLAGALDIHLSRVETAGALTRTLAKYRHDPNCWLLSLFLLRAMSRAEYRAVPAPHFGLGLEAYLHFTSPIRRYADLVVHRLVKAAINGERSGINDELPELARQISRRERLVLEAERDVVSVYKALYMKGFIHHVLNATVTAVTSHGVFVFFTDTKCDGFLPVERIKSDWFEANEAKTQLIGERSGRTITIGDAVDVFVLDVNVRRRHVTVILAEDRESLSP
ncbi:MAG: ribonuclease R [Myxococcota bacterium]|nr:ribonuclease R [Myxococcota bacterium]